MPYLLIAPVEGDADPSEGAVPQAGFTDDLEPMKPLAAEEQLGEAGQGFGHGLAAPGTAEGLTFAINTDGEHGHRNKNGTQFRREPSRSLAWLALASGEPGRPFLEEGGQALLGIGVAHGGLHLGAFGLEA